MRSTSLTVPAKGFSLTTCNPAFNAAIVAVSGLLLGWIGVLFGRLKDRLYDELGLVKYTVVIGLFLMMTGVLGKILLRLLFGIKYIFSLSQFNLNI